MSGLCVPDGGCNADGDCPSGDVCVDGGCAAGQGCSNQTVGFNGVPPNLLITLDRSCSMVQAPVDGGASKWHLAVDAISKLTNDFQGQIDFGLTLFPARDGGAKCDVEHPEIALSPGNETALQTLLEDSFDAGFDYPNGPCVTPIDSGLHASASDPALADPTRQSFLLLITDGEQAGCSLYGGADGGVGIIKGLTHGVDGGPPVHTFVLGFGNQVNATELTRFALAGGEAFDAGPAGLTFYRAEDAQTLADALHAIGVLTTGCTVKLDNQPPAVDLIYVFFNGTSTQVASDPANGWQYEASSNEIEFFGSSCQQIQSGEVTQIYVEFGCLVE
jgi:hypothetical protein